MSLESSLERIAVALEQYIAMQNPAMSDAPAPEVAAPVPLVVPASVVSTNPVAPVVPIVPAPAPVLPFPGAGAPQVTPFQDVPGLVSYTMQAYQEIGPENGAKIQGVLSGLGYNNINDVKPEHFAQFYAQIEMLKSGG